MMIIFTRKVNSILMCFLLFYVVVSIQNVYAEWQYVGAFTGRTVRSVAWVNAGATVIVGGDQNTNMAARYIWQGRVGETFFNTDTTLSQYTDVTFPEYTWTGYTVGWGGAILKTVNASDTWFYLTKYLPATVSAHDFNGVYFINNNEGYVVGGKGDTTQTIIKTTDGGNTWTVQRNTAGAALNSIYFISNTTGIAVGDNGTILRTTNGGLSWAQISRGGVNTRNFNKITFNMGVGFVVGGDKSGTVATILKSIDNGNTWTVIQDDVSQPALNSISFKNKNEGYAVGNKGIILYTNDGGNTWAHFTELSVAFNDTTRNLRTVSFFNDYSGAFGGDNGKYFVYREDLPQKPIVVTGGMELDPTHKARLSGTVNPQGIATATVVTFEYGTTANLGKTIKVPGVFNGYTTENVSVVTPALADGIYYYRITASNTEGSDTGNIKQFYIGPNPIPNFDFEEWVNQKAMAPFGENGSEVPLEQPVQWMSLISERIVSYDGSNAVKLRPLIEGGDENGIGLLLLGTIANDMPSGGFPLNALPDSIVGYFNYSTAENAPAVFAVLLKKDGDIVGMVPNYIGGNEPLSSNGEFERLAFPMTYQDDIVPDSAIIVILTGDALFGNGEINSDNLVEVDNLSFTGVDVPIPNGDFEDWYTLTIHHPVSWGTAEGGNPWSERINITTDAQHGNFAVVLQNEAATQKADYLRLELPGQEHWNSKISVGEKYAALQGYYKYFPAAEDSAHVKVTMYKDGNTIGQGLYYFEPVSEYTLFTNTINYWIDEIPDSTTIEFYTLEDKDREGFVIQGNSKLYIDNLSFGTNTTEDTLTVTNIKKPTVSSQTLKIYPNPAKDFIAVELSKDEQIQSLLIVDLNGKSVESATIENTYNVKMLNVSGLATGTYILHIQTAKQQYVNKFIKQ